MNINFIDLINKYKIVIPIIQRDYAQGRITETTKANKFLTSISDGLGNGLNLDFVYGKIDVDKKIFIPLDGQQRLTTLLLIHWYVSLENIHLPQLEKFSYEVRSSTKDFLEKLVKKENWEKLRKDNITKSIENSSWFFLSWEKDPTVVALLNMLNLIESKFKSIEILSLNNITFEFLNLDEFKLTDELYIKMNSRGKPLTDFENFKANLEIHIDDYNIKAKLDNDWLDVFFKLAKNKVRKINDAPILADKLFHNFFYNVTFNFYVENNDFDRNFLTINTIFDFYEKVYPNKIEEVIKILDKLDINNETFKKFTNLDISYWERANFYALSLAFINNLNDEELTHWNRVTYNLINNQLIDSPDDFKKTVRSLKQLSINSNNNIYSYIADNTKSISYFERIQREEECLKAKLILENIHWENEFIELERNWYLDGQIKFILDFSNNQINTFKNYKEKFIFVFEFLKNSKENQILFYQALLTKGDYLPDIGSNYTFCSFDVALRTKRDNWRKFFNNKRKNIYLKELFDDTDLKINQLKDSLKNIIQKYDVMDWKNLLIKNSDYIKYCTKLQIRWNSSDFIYLLSKSRRNGAHKELYSWDLYLNEFKTKSYKPFSHHYYYDSISEYEPEIVFDNWEYQNLNFSIGIASSYSGFCINLYEKEDRLIPKEIKDILEKNMFNSIYLNKKTGICKENLHLEISQLCNDFNTL